MRAVWFFGVLILLSCLFGSYVDPFGLSTVSRNVARDAYHDAFPLSAPKDERPNIVVLLIEDEDLPILQASYPVDYARHAEILEDVAALGAEIVFVNFAFLDERDPAASLRLNEAFRSVSHTTDLVLVAPEAVRSEGAASSALFKGLERNPRIRFADPRLGETLGATLTMPARSSGTYAPSSVAIREIYCVTSPCAPSIARAPAFIEPSWPVPPTGCLAFQETQGCDTIATAPFLRFWEDFRSASLPRFFPRTDQISLPPYLTLTIRELYTLRGAPELLKGAVVFYGADFDGVNDNVISPVYGRTPGIYAHAAAFETLVLQADRAIAFGNPFGLPSDTWIALMCLVTVAAWAIVRMFLLQDAATPGLFSFRPVAADYGFIALVAVSLSVLEVILFRTSPANWLLTPMLAFGSVGSADLMMRVGRWVRA